MNLELKNVSFKYTGIAASEGDVLKNINVSFGKNECVAIVGPSGSGKTTLIQHFTGLHKPTTGMILYDGKDIFSKDFSLADLRKKIGLVFQFPETQLFEETVYKDIAFGPTNMDFSKDEIKSLVVQAMQDVQLDEKYMEKSPFQLSEGEKRRAAIAGVLAMGGDMIVFDEPTAGLDPGGVQRVVTLIQRLLTAGKSIVLITHNMDFAAQIADRMVVMVDGHIIFDDKPNILFSDQNILQKADLESPSFVKALFDRKISLPADLRNLASTSKLIEFINEHS